MLDKENFEAFTGIPPESAVELTSDEMDDIRGRFLDIFFSIEFFGVAQANGDVDANLSVDVRFNEELGSLSFPNGGAPSTGDTPATGGANGSTDAVVTNPVTGDSFRVYNEISNSFGNGNVQAQVIQNNGNGANLSNLSIMNFVVLNVAEGEVNAVRSSLSNIFGGIGQ